MTENVRVEGPAVDEETGMRTYRVIGERGEATFGIVPVDDGGVERWIMRPGADVALPTDPGYEPYDSAEQAYEAGMRASRAALSAG